MRIYSFTEKENPDIRQVGGKGLSLILMTGAGFPVPPGIILPAAFFKPWFQALEGGGSWADFLNSTSETLHHNCSALKEEAMGFVFNEEQRRALEQGRSLLGEPGGLFAVRSSSPEEDLEGASFAGGYETLLGVKSDGIEEAVKRAFVSCLDERVFLYKKEHGFDVFAPKIAVIIQKQIPSESAGVAFSLNPLNNCYDETVINANFGLGESVVAGLVTPDQFVVDKTAPRILRKRIGKKELVIQLNNTGGTSQAPGHEGASLTDQQAIAVSDMTSRVESHYGKPMDIEWAYYKDELFLLQARPITAYIPLPKEMQTPPGERRKLYLDLLLAKQGIHKPISIAGLNCLEFMQRLMLGKIMGSEKVIGFESGLFFNLGCRSYSHISNGLRFQGQKRVAMAIKSQDMISFNILSGPDILEYMTPKLPNALRGVVWGSIKNSIPMIKTALKAFKKPGEYHDFFKKESAGLVRSMKELAGKGPELGIEEFVGAIFTVYNDYLINTSLPVSYAAEMARAKMKGLFKKESQEVKSRIVFLEQALPNNVTIEMGMALYDLSGFGDIQKFAHGEEFAKKLANRELSPEFLKAWDDFVETYGFRCPGELDLASPRFYDTPEEAFNQLRNLSGNRGQETNPRAVFEQGRRRREESAAFFRQLAGKKGVEKKFLKYYEVLEAFGAYREIHKYYIIMALDHIRKRMLKLGRQWVAAGRLDEAEQVFHLKVGDIARGVADAGLDLRQICENNTVFWNKIKDVRNFPRIIDSRGKILHAPPREIREGEIEGEPISPGVVRGKVKVLKAPDEKPLLPGEILVARATDPGWTPLFLNAGGIILEVGGLLQHGALVAREYCKPCVAGIENVTSLLKDGQMVEIDGMAGIVKTDVP